MNNDWQVEQYIPGENTELAQELWDKGLIYLINNILHVYGYALGVIANEVSDRVEGLNIHKTSDPSGIWFGEDLHVSAREKMRKAGLL